MKFQATIAMMNMIMINTLVGGIVNIKRGRFHIQRLLIKDYKKYNLKMELINLGFLIIILKRKEVESLKVII